MIRPPCKTCPWRIGASAQDIPNFDLELAEGLVGCNTGEFGAHVMACHQSRPEQEFVCAGWLAREGENNIYVRLGVASGKYPPEALSVPSEWPPLYETYTDVLSNLRRTWHL